MAVYELVAGLDGWANTACPHPVHKERGWEICPMCAWLPRALHGEGVVVEAQPGRLFSTSCRRAVNHHFYSSAGPYRLPAWFETNMREYAPGGTYG